MEMFGRILMTAGVIAILIGYVGIVFCGFAISFGRGIRNLFVPFVGFGDAMRRFPLIIWLWGVGIAATVISTFFT